MPNRLAQCLQKTSKRYKDEKDVTHPALDHLMKRGLLAEASRLVTAQDVSPQAAEIRAVSELRDKAVADIDKVEAALKGEKAEPQAATRARPVNREEAIAGAIERMHTTPEESFALSRRLLPAYEKVRAKTKEMQENIPPVEQRDPQEELDQLDAKETLAQENLDAQLEAAKEKLSQEIADQYAGSIGAARDISARRHAERLAETARINRLRGIEKQFVEKRKALASDFTRQRQILRAKVRDFNLQATKEGKEMAAELEHVRAFSELNAITGALPPSVRERIGGNVTLAQLRGKGQSITNFMVSRIERIDTELQKHFREVYRERIEALIKRTAPITRPGQKPRGKIGIEAHRIVTKITAVTGISAEASEDKKVEILAKLAEAEAGDTTQIEALMEDLLIMEIFGALDKMTNVGTLERAYNYLADIYTEGRNEQRAVNAMRVSNVKAMRDAAIADTGKTGSYAELDDRMKVDKAIASYTAGLGGAMHSFLSFEQIVQIALGKNSVIGKQFVARERAAKQAKRRALLQNQKAVNDLLVRAFPNIKSPLGRERKRWEMQQRELGVRVAGTRLSQLEAVHMSMLWAQDRYKEGMALHGWTDAAMTELENQLTPEAKMFREFFAEKYRTGHASINDVFKRMYGMDLPQEANYAPGTFEHEGPAPDTDPYGHGLIPEGGMAAGFLKARRKHNAMPRIEDALNIFLGHVAQTEHWKAYAELTRDMRAVTKSVEVNRAIRAKAGENIATSLEGWVTAFEKNGIKARSFGKDMDNFLRRFQSVRARLALAWNIGTMMKQSTAALSALADMPVMDFMKGLAKLFTGQLETRKIFNSQAIQDRMKSGYSPEARMGMEAMFNSAPNISGEIVEAGLEMIGHVDAFFTTASAAIAYDYHYRQAIKSGMDAASAEKAAMTGMEATVARTAQPTEMSDRSLWELGLSPAGRSIFMFMSETRQKLALEYMALRNLFAGNDPLFTRAGELGRVLFLNHFIIPTIMWGITSMLRDWRDDDDDEVFDLEHWNPMDWLVTAAAGPLAAIPLLADVLSIDPFKYPSEIAQTFQSAKKIFKEGWPEDEEDRIKTAKKLLGGVSWLMAMWGRPEGELANVGARDAQLILQVMDNFSGEPKD